MQEPKINCAWTEVLKRPATWKTIMASLFHSFGVLLSRMGLAAPKEVESGKLEWSRNQVTKYDDIDILVAGLDRVGTAPLTVARLEGLLRTHAQFYNAARFPKGDALHKRIQKEVRVVQQALPTLDDDGLLSAAVAWFALLIAVDDEIDVALQTHPDADVEAILDRCIAVLEKAINSSGTPAQKGQSDTQEESLSWAFVSRTRKLLPRDVHFVLLIAVLKHWQACKQECLWKRRGSIPEDEYLTLRRETIGITPFFTLLLHHYGCSKLAVEERKIFHQMLNEARLVVGLQNDLAGMERDVAQGQVMNFMLIEGDVAAEAIKSRCSRAAELHDQSMLVVEQCWHTVHAGRRENAKAFADSLITFLRQHFLWANNAKRYKS